MVFDSIILEIAIGIVFIYVLLSLICTAASEFIARVLALRSNNLAEGIRNLLNDPDAQGLAKDFYKHPLITGFYKEGFTDKRMNWLARSSLGKRFKIDKWFWGGPSYIPSHIFVTVLLDIVAPGSTAASKTIQDLRDAVAASNNIDEKTRKALLALIDNSNYRVKDAQKNIEDWFDDAMDRVSGWYKRSMQTIVLVLALVIVFTANADTIMLSNNLAQDSTLRASIVKSAEAFTANQSLTPGSNVSFNETADAIGQLKVIPMGWSKEPCTLNIFNRTCNTPEQQDDYGGWFSRKIIGLLITAFALSLGAPFWFDILSKFVNLRGTGKPSDGHT